jgi:hypothetical protein
VVYSKYAGTEVEFNGEAHMLLKEDDMVGLLLTEDVKDLKLANDRVMIQVKEVRREEVLGRLDELLAVLLGPRRLVNDSSGRSTRKVDAKDY